MKMIYTICLSLLFVFVGNLNAENEIDFDKDNFNLICTQPLVSDLDKRNKVYKAIYKGYMKQLRSLTYKVQKFNDIQYKYYGNNQRSRIAKRDDAASEEFLAMLEAVNEYFERHDANKKTKTKNGSDNEDEFSNEEEFDFSETELEELTKKGDSQEDKYKTLFVDSMNSIASIYKTRKTSDNLWLVPFSYADGSVENVAPNVVFGEYFNPSKQGRRYFLNINIFFFIIDSDGDARVMSKEISDYNWKRNFRFISAQSGKVIQDTVTKFTGLDIR
ncbi:MAG: hypothetical protein U9O56_07000 [Campylobacterota bacterium]|nr:hypothetical protein [Campylobacterota bacterium]